MQDAHRMYLYYYYITIFFYMTQTSFSPGHASIYSKIPKSFESTALHVCNSSDEPPLITSEMGGGREGKSVMMVNQTTNYMSAAT